MAPRRLRLRQAEAALFTQFADIHKLDLTYGAIHGTLRIASSLSRRALRGASERAASIFCSTAPADLLREARGSTPSVADADGRLCARARRVRDSRSEPPQPPAPGGGGPLMATGTIPTAAPWERGGRLPAKPAPRLVVARRRSSPPRPRRACNLQELGSCDRLVAQASAMPGSTSTCTKRGPGCENASSRRARSSSAPPAMHEGTP